MYLLIIEIYLSNIHHNELNKNKSINRKIAIILTAKFNRIMLKEIYIPIPILITKIACKKSSGWRWTATAKVTQVDQNCSN